MDTDDRTRHLAEVVRWSGQRINLMDHARVEDGWVVTSQVPDQFWKRCKLLDVWPLEPKKFLGKITLPTPAACEYARWVIRYGRGIVVVLMLNDVEYVYGPVLLSDLERDTYDLLDEMVALAGPDMDLSNAKSRAAMMVAGWTDTQ